MLTQNGPEDDESVFESTLLPLFGNFNALAMQPLGDMAGLGSAIIGSVTNLQAVVLSIFIGGFMEQSVVPISLAFVVCGLLSLISIKLAHPR